MTGTSRGGAHAPWALAAVLALVLVGWASWPRQAPSHAIPSALLSSPDFIPPTPGSYRLEKILRAPDGTVLDASGAALPLAQFTTGKITLLSFLYTRCSDTMGCPYALVVFHQLQAALAADPALVDQVRLVSLSFDPVNDTPEVMRLYGGDAARPRPGVAWHFLTTSGPRALVPLLEGFGQDVSIAAAATAPSDGGRATSDYAHMLKVFLIDASGVVREIYTTAFLQPRVMMNDIQTLAMEGKARARGS